MDILSAKNNEKIKFAVSLRDSARLRRESKMFFLEGARLCSDAAENGIDICRAFVTRAALSKYAERCERILRCAEECYEITDAVAEKLSDTQNTQGIFCICRISRDVSHGIDRNGKYLMLENVQDPSNLGAITRTAEALGIDGLIVFGGCDIYNPKALRASMGSALRLNIIECDDIAAMLAEAQRDGMMTVASTPDRASEPVTDLDMDGGVICVVGNEGNGITDETMSLCRKKATIPMGGRAESLNAATAAAILIWEMVRK